LPALDILLDHVYLVEDFDAALRLASELPDSTAVTPGGQAVSGPRLKAAASGGLADLSRKRSQAEAELETERKAAEAATEALSIAQRNLTAALQDEEVARAEQARRAGEVAGLRVQALTAANTTAERARVLARAQALLVAQQAELERAGSEAASLRGARDALREELAEAQAAAAQARRELDQVPPRPEGDEVRLVAEAVLQMERENLERQVGLAHQEEALVQAEELERLEQATLAELTERMGGEDADLVAEAEVDWERTQREVSRLERQLAQLGPVNELAIEEYERDRSRLGGIDVQLEDLQRAREDLGQLAGTLGEEIERRFDAVFGAVAFNFQELFGELFAGGRATLSLDRAEGDEPGDAGVEILAQPAGKRMRNIRLLSGGERALTALAFILALEKVNPSPFYVLDEVDAPLDDANVRRFNVMLNSMAAGNQFILVTHNHQTMTSARALYGVTLEDSGVSRVVSVRLQGGEVVAAGEPQSQIVAG